MILHPEPQKSKSTSPQNATQATGAAGACAIVLSAAGALMSPPPATGANGTGACAKNATPAITPEVWHDLVSTVLTSYIGCHGVEEGTARVQSHLVDWPVPALCSLIHILEGGAVL